MRSLADDLRARSDPAVAALVQARPDLLTPVPADLASLALRAGSPASVATCLRGYDQLTLHAVLAAAMGPDPVRPAALVTALTTAAAGPGARDRARAAVARLRADALLWGGDRAVHLVGAARDLMVPADRGPRVAALDPVVAGYVRDPDAVRTLVALAPPGVRAALDRLLAGPVIGTVVDARRAPDPSRSPVDWMLDQHLVLPLGTDRVVVPAEVVAILRHAPAEDPARTVLPLVMPAPAQPAPDRQRTDAGGVGAILDVLHGIGELGLMWASEPPALLRTGGISLREQTRVAKALGVKEEVAALLIEVAGAAGLLATDSTESVSVLPTTWYDAWVAEPPAERHAALLRAWVAMPRSVAGADRRPMSAELASPTLPDLRRDVLRVLAAQPGAWRDDEVLSALDWYAPRRAEAARPGRVRDTLDQLRTLGILVGGALTSAGHALAAEAGPGPGGGPAGGWSGAAGGGASGAAGRGANPASSPASTLATPSAQGPVGDTLVTELAATLPGLVDRLVLQADLTAIVPGLPSAELAGLMRAMADPESTGAASVYRFTPASIRRALDSGRTAAELLEALRRRGTVPQPLAYLIDDVARRHAALRIGALRTYLRCDDPAVLAGILADPGTASLGLVALSDTVLGAQGEPEDVLARLRELGHTPQAEGAGAPQVAGPRRARSRPREAAGPVVVTPALAAAAVRAMRASDRGAHTPGLPGPAEVHPVPIAEPSAVVAALRAAIADESAVWIGYADTSGVAGDRRVEPLRLAGGYLTALDLRSESIATFALARITGVLPA